MCTAAAPHGVARNNTQLSPYLGGYLDAPHASAVRCLDACIFLMVLYPHTEPFVTNV